MARIATTEGLVYERILARIIAEVDGANESSCYLSLDPDEIAGANSGDFVFVISPAPASQYDAGMYGGGGDHLLVENAIFTVTIHSSSQLDEIGRDAEFLNDVTYGILIRKKAVLKALVDYDLLDASGNEILVEPIEPADAHKHRTSRSQGSVQLAFHVKFEWDLT